MSTEQDPPTIDAKVLETAVDIQVFNSDGGIVRFGEIFANHKTVVVFIREHTNPTCPYIFSVELCLSEGHFFCGVRPGIVVFSLTASLIPRHCVMS
jgi:hypothetical protein